jgi:hypothetical protein
MTPTPTLSAPCPPTWCGWHRAGNRLAWTKLTEQASEKECWRVLLDILHELPGRGGESVCLPAGRHPNDNRRQPR